LSHRVEQVERLRVEKARSHKYKREKVAYVETSNNDQEFDVAIEDVKVCEINVDELKARPPYTCKLLRHSDGKNHVESKKKRNMFLKPIRSM